MNTALRIFRKDVRRLWPRIVLVAGIEVAAQLAHSAPTRAWARAGGGLPALEVLAQWFLIASVIQAEPLVGDRQYWLTRPISWKGLAAAKLLFVLVFIHAPVLAGDVSALILRGESPWAHLAGLSMAQFFTLERVLGGVAVASITAGLVQFVWTFLAACVSFVLILEVVAARIGGDISWGGLEWIHAAAIAVFLILGALAILAVQYAARNAGRSRRILGAVVLTMVPLMWMPGWHAAFSLQSRIDGTRVPDSVARIVRDSPRGKEVDPLPASQWGLGPQPFSMEIPVLVTGVPAGMGLWSDRVAASAETANGSVWVSAWDPLNRIAQVIGDEKTTREERMLPGGDTWLYLNVDRYPASPEYRAGRNVHATAALTLLSAEQITPLAADGQAARVPESGLCWVEGKQDMSVTCSWPYPTPGYAAIRVRTKSMGNSETPLLSLWPLGDLSYGPCDGWGGLWQTATAYIGNAPDASDVILVTRRVVAHIERGIDMHPAGGGRLP